MSGMDAGVAAQRTGPLVAAEHATLWTLFATVSLFTTGRISSAYYLNALGIHGLHLDVAWPDRVFEGGVAVINMCLKATTEPSRYHLPWLVAAGIFGVALWRRKAAKRTRTRAVMTALACASYLALLVLISATWGQVQAEMLRDKPGARDHFVFAADALPRLPPALAADNDQRKLRLVTTTPDFFIVLSGDNRIVYRIAARDIDALESNSEP